MGAAYAELTGRPGVLVVGVGPGAANAVNGVAHAFLDRIPFLLVTDRYSPAEAGSSGHQLIDQERLFSAITKWQAVVDDPDSARAVTEQALRIGLTPPWGPVHLELPRDAARALAPGGDAALVTAKQAGWAGADLGAAATALRDALRPIVVVGHEARAGVRQKRARQRRRAAAGADADDVQGEGVSGDAPAERGDRHGRGDREALPREGGRRPRRRLRPGRAPGPAVGLVGADGRAGRTLRTIATWRPDGRSPATSARLSRSSTACWATPAPSRRACGGRGTRRRRLGRGAPDSRARVARLVEDVEAVQAVCPEETTVSQRGRAHVWATWFWRASRPGRFLTRTASRRWVSPVPGGGGLSCGPVSPVIALTGRRRLPAALQRVETAVRLETRGRRRLNDASLSLIRASRRSRSERAAIELVRRRLRPSRRSARGRRGAGPLGRGAAALAPALAEPTSDRDRTPPLRNRALRFHRRSEDRSRADEHNQPRCRHGDHRRRADVHRRDDRRRRSLERQAVCRDPRAAVPVRSTMQSAPPPRRSSGCGDARRQSNAGALSGSPS